jgi:hypothetical protein
MVAAVAWECPTGLVVVVVVVAVIVGDVVNANEVGGTGISADVTDMTV